MAGPGQRSRGVEHARHSARRRRRRRPDRPARRRSRRLRHQVAAQLVRLGAPSPRGRCVVQSGASADSRARPSASRSPRLRRDQRVQLVEDHAPAASRTDSGASAGASSSASCSGVVSRMSGGSRLLALALEAGVSPVRVSMRTAAPSRRPAFRGCARRRRPAPSAARCRACAGRRAAQSAGRSSLAPGRRAPHSARPGSAESRPASCRRRSARSAAPSGRPAPWPAARAGGRAGPAAAGEPGGERCRQDRSALEHGHGGRLTRAFSARHRLARRAVSLTHVLDPAIAGNARTKAARPRRGHRRARLFRCVPRSRRDARRQGRRRQASRGT